MINRTHLLNYSKQLLLTLGVAFIITCGGGEKPNEHLQKAYKIHEDAISVSGQVTDQLTKLAANSDSSFVATFRGELDSIRLALDAWNEQVVEVPGFEEEHDHSGHDHSHGNQPELTPEQHLEVQQHLLKEVQRIEKKINQIGGKL